MTSGASPTGSAVGRIAGDSARPPLRIGLVGSCYWPVAGGMEVYLRELAQALAAEGHEVRVVTRFARARPPDMAGLHGGAEDARRYMDGSVRVDVVAPRRGFGLALRAAHRLHFRAPSLAVGLLHMALRRPMRRALAGVDVIHYSGAGRELLGFVARREAARGGVPFILTPHTHEGIWGDSALDINLYRRATRVVALTEDERRRLERAGIPSATIEVVGHGVSVRGGGDGRRFRARYGLKDDPVVLFLGRKAREKGYDLLLESARELWSTVPTARIVLAGAAGAPRSLPHAIDDARVLDLDHLSDDEREDAYAACDVFCLPSEAEAFGLVVLEAWAYGKPVVVSDIPTLRERVEPAGGVTTARRPHDVAVALARLLTDVDLRSRLGSAGRAIAGLSSWQSTARSMVALYREGGACAHMHEADQETTIEGSSRRSPALDG